MFKIDPADNPKNVHPDYLAKALVIKVFPFPGGPYNKIPLGGDLIPSNKSGLFWGIMTASYKIYLSSLIPIISENDALMSLETNPTTSLSI